jgi:hypothetical protein
MKHFPTFLEYSVYKTKELGIDLDALDEKAIDQYKLTGVLLGIYQKHERYCQLGESFYSQPLALWMFVPCGEDGELLEYPHYYSQFVKGHLGAGYNPNRMEDTEWCDECKAYQIAQQRILFKGFQFCGGNTVQCSEFSLNIEEYNSIDAFVNSCTGSFTVTPTQSAKTILNLPE